MPSRVPGGSRAVPGTGPKPRSVPLHPRVIFELTRLKHREGPVFLTHKGMPYDKPKPGNDDDHSAGTRIKTAFKVACRRAGIVDFSPHCCRHTWATWHYQANRDFTALQELGGWKSVSMVLRYAHTNVSQHAQSIENLPGENWRNGTRSRRKTQHDP
jgi:integrase